MIYRNALCSAQISSVSGYRFLCIFPWADAEVEMIEATEGEKQMIGKIFHRISSGVRKMQSPLPSSPECTGFQ